MKYFYVFFILLAASNNLYACPGSSSFFGSYKPLFAPVEIVVDKSGVSVTTSGSVVTPWGVFKLGYNKDFSKEDNECIYVVIENVNTNKVHIYEIPNGKNLKAQNVSLESISISPNTIKILVKKGESYKFTLSKDDSRIKIEKSLIRYQGGNIEVGNDFITIPIDDIAYEYKKILTGSLLNPGVGSLKYLGFLYRLSRNNGSNSDTFHIQIFATKELNSAAQQVEYVKSQGIDDVTYMKVKDGYYKVILGSYSDFYEAKEKQSFFSNTLINYPGNFIVKINY